MKRVKGKQLCGGRIITYGEMQRSSLVYCTWKYACHVFDVSDTGEKAQKFT